MENIDNENSSATQPKNQPYTPTPYVPRTSTPEYKAFKEKVVSKKGLLITLLSIALCILFTETIFFGSTGVSVIVFAAAYYPILYYVFRETGVRLNKAGVYLTVPVVIIAFSFLLHYNPSVQPIAWLTLFGMVCIQLILLSGIPVSGIFSLDMVLKIIVNLIAKTLSNLGMPFNSFGVLKTNRSKSLKNLTYVLVGIAVAFPVSAILMSLFMSADAVFADAMKTVIQFFGINFNRTFWVISFGIIFGICLGAMLLSLKYSGVKQSMAVKSGDCIESMITGTFLTILNILIVTFVVFQFVYLFGGSVNITASGLSYSEYARRGFFELSAASAIIFAISLFALIMTKKNEEKLSLWVRLGTVLLCLCDGVLLVSSMKRMLMYVDAYGLSVKRVLTLWFMVLIGFCLVWMIAKCFAPKLDVMKWIGITVITGVCLLSLVNVDRTIARYNVDMYLQNPADNSIDIQYFNWLSYSAVPEIDRLLDQGVKANQPELDKIMQHYKTSLQWRNDVYGFTLDSIKAQEIINRHFKN